MANVVRGYFKDYHSLTIQGWMINRLGLSGNRLLVYAAIYQYSSMGTSEFSGGEYALASLCTASLDTIRVILNELAEKRLIYISEIEFKGKKHRTYKTNFKKVYACLQKEVE